MSLHYLSVLKHIMITALASLDKHHRIVLALTLLAIIGGGWFYALSQGDTVRYPDEAEYLTLSQSLVDRHAYSLDGTSPTAYRAPGYPAFLALLRVAGAGVRVMRGVQYVLLAGTALMIFLLLRPLSRSGAVLGAIGAGVYPLGFYTAGVFYPQTLASALFVLLLWLVLRTRLALMRDAVLGGGVAGVLVLTVPTFAIIIAFLALWILWGGRGRQWRGVAMLAVAGGLVLTPWTVRNYLVFGQPVFVASNTGINLLLGNSENTTPNAGVNVDVTPYLDAARGMGELERDRYFTQAAVSYVQTHKLRSLRMYLLKALNYYNYRNVLLVKSESSRARDAVMLISYGGLLVLCGLRLAWVRRFPWTDLERVALSVYVLNGLYAAVFFTRLRFRLPFDYLLIAVAALFVARVLASSCRANRQTK